MGWRNENVAGFMMVYLFYVCKIPTGVCSSVSCRKSVPCSRSLSITFVESFAKWAEQRHRAEPGSCLRECLWYLAIPAGRRTIATFVF
jgi:hypothetical protein